MKKFMLCTLLLLITACSFQNNQISGDPLTGEFVFMTSQFVLDKGGSRWNLVSFDIPYEEDNVQDIPLFIGENCIKTSRNVCGIGEATAYIDKITIQNLSDEYVGNIHYITTNPTIGTIYLINHDLTVKFCQPQLMRATNSSFTILPESEVLFVERVDSKQGQVIQYNLDSCSVTYAGELEQGLKGIVQSEKGMTAKLYIAYDADGQVYEIIKIISDQDEQLFEIPNTRMPLFSDNGEMLAYVDTNKKTLSIMKTESFEMIGSDIAKGKKIKFFTWESNTSLLIITEDNEIFTYEINSGEITYSYFFSPRRQVHFLQRGFKE